MNKNALYKFTAICSAIAALSFLVLGVLSDFDSTNTARSVVFVANTIIFSSIAGRLCRDSPYSS